MKCVTDMSPTHNNLLPKVLVADYSACMIERRSHRREWTGLGSSIIARGSTDLSVPFADECSGICDHLQTGLLRVIPRPCRVCEMF